MFSICGIMERCSSMYCRKVEVQCKYIGTALCESKKYTPHVPVAWPHPAASRRELDDMANISARINAKHLVVIVWPDHKIRRMNAVYCDNKSEMQRRANLLENIEPGTPRAQIMTPTCAAHTDSSKKHCRHQGHNTYVVRVLLPSRRNQETMHTHDDTTEVRFFTNIIMVTCLRHYNNRLRFQFE